MRSLPLCLLSAAVLASGCSLVPSLSVTPRYGKLGLDGDLRANSSNVTATGDLENLGLGDDEGAFQPRVDLSVGPWDIVLSGYSVGFEGDGTADVTFDLGGATITAGEDVASKLDLANLSLLAIWDFVPTDLVDVGLGVGVQGLDLQATVVSQTSGETIDTDQQVPIPVAAARVATRLFDLELSGVASGLAIDVSGVEASFLDLDLMASWTFERFLGFHGALVGGYRYIALDAEYEDGGSDVLLDFSLSGPFIGLTLGL